MGSIGREGARQRRHTAEDIIRGGESTTIVIGDGQFTLASLAQVCRAFSEPALQTLWRDIPNFSPLLRLFPGCKHIVQDPDEDNEALYTYVSPEEVAASMSFQVSNYPQRPRSTFTPSTIRSYPKIGRIFSTIPTLSDNAAKTIGTSALMLPHTFSYSNATNSNLYYCSSRCSLGPKR